MKQHFQTSDRFPVGKSNFYNELHFSVKTVSHACSFLDIIPNSDGFAFLTANIVDVSVFNGCFQNHVELVAHGLIEFRPSIWGESCFLKIISHKASITKICNIELK